jgi:hypothetical protein
VAAGGAAVFVAAAGFTAGAAAGGVSPAEQATAHNVVQAIRIRK